MKVFFFQSNLFLKIIKSTMILKYDIEFFFIELNVSVEVSNSIASVIAERCRQRFELDLNVVLVDMEGNYLNDNFRK